MAQKRRDLVSTFVAADNTGRKVMIRHYRESVLQAASDGGDEWTPTGTIILVTEDGRDVKWKEKGVYEIASTRGTLLLKSDDAEAP